uniref:Transferrin receptor 1b n=1 Tax=Acanthochromis polyacanthus TaxID=80966 RepID=A0A3Q1F2Y6_9TELE
MMDRMRLMFNGVVKSERYSRFTLQPTEDGGRHAEVKLSDDATDDATDMEAGGSPTFRPAPLQRNRWTLFYIALVTVLVFVFGFLIGFASHRPSQVEPVNCGTTTGMTTPTTGMTTPKKETPPPAAPAQKVQLDWNDITQLLTMKLTSQTFEKTLTEFALPSRSAGSKDDMNQADHIFDEFKKLEMEPWNDVHYVKLQTPDSKAPNHVVCGSVEFNTAGYLAYSATGKVQGKLVYGNYGRPEDLEVVKKNIELNSSVLLLRAGKISFAEQVANAAKKGVAAVLIYPDPQDYSYVADTVLYGHVHLGSGDPYTPGFPSFNHTQFPPTQSSGLPKIPAQTITANNAAALLKKIGGPAPDASSGFKGKLDVSYNLGGIEDITVEVNNMLVDREIHNVFGVIKGFIDPDRYVVLGAQRDAWGEGYAKATVGTSILMELARAVHKMIEEDGFRPRRSIVFASWSAGEYGSVGATEWLEAHMSSIDKNVFTYISLDGVVMGRGSFIASASPLLYSLLERTMKEVKNPVNSRVMMYNMTGNDPWETKVMRPMMMDDPAYPFLAFAGIPSVSFHFISSNSESYMYYGTNLDNRDNFSYQTNHRSGEMVAAAAQFAGQMALRLVHDHLLSLDVSSYKRLLTKTVKGVSNQVKQLSQKDVSATWLFSARGSFVRAADSIANAIKNTDLSDDEACRILNSRIMRIEHTLLSPYVSPVKTPFRHLLFGRGPHTLASIAETANVTELHTQLALATWNLQGCANAMVGNIWDLDNQI